MTDNKIYEKDETIEITNLPICNKNIIINYEINSNPINNDSVTINQIVKYPKNNIMKIDDKNYYLIQIEWRKTNFTIDNKKIGLTLHLIHTDYISPNKVIIIIPLDLVKDKNEINIVENMINIDKLLDKLDIDVDKKKMIKVNDILNNIYENVKTLSGYYKLFIEYKRKYDIKNVNVDLLLKNKIEIPMFQCCKNTIGPVTNIDLCVLKKIIETSSTNYMIKEQNGNTNLIIEPNIFNENDGLQMISYIQKDENLTYMK
jgi:hypothetical protein